MINRLARAFFILITIAALLIGGIATLLAREISRPADPNDRTVVQFEVPENQNVTEIADLLRSDGLISQPLLFRWLVREQGAESDFKAGTYVLTKGMTMSEIISVMRQDRGGRGGPEAEIVIREGERLEQIAENMTTQSLAPDPEAFMAVVRNAAPFKEQHERLRSIPDVQGLEGYIFPNTYRFFVGDPVTDTVNRLLEQFDTEYQKIEGQIAVTNAEGQPRSVHEIVTMAALLQREAANTAEMPHLAHIFWQRLTPDATQEVGNRLQSDPTLQYILGAPGDWWPDINTRLTREQIDTYDNPYNTYRNTGLPPGPISNPGLDALRSAAQPSAQRPDGTDGTRDLYFVRACTEEPSHAYAATNAEFVPLVEQFRNCPLFQPAASN